MAVRIAEGQPTGELLLPLVARLLQRVNDLERRVQEVECWLGDVADDVAPLVGRDAAGDTGNTARR